MLVYTIRGFGGKELRDPPEILTTWTTGLDKTPALQHRAGTAKVRPKQTYGS